MTDDLANAHETPQLDNNTHNLPTQETSLPGVYLASEFPHPPPKRRELSQVDNGGFWPVSPGGGRDGAVMLLGGKGTFHSS